MRHATPDGDTLREECVVLSGDLRFGDEVMRAGDYQVAEAGSTHQVLTTREGCTLFVISATDNVILP